MENLDVNLAGTTATETALALVENADTTGTPDSAEQHASTETPEIGTDKNPAHNIRNYVNITTLLTMLGIGGMVTGCNNSKFDLSNIHDGTISKEEATSILMGHLKELFISEACQSPPPNLEKSPLSKNVLKKIIETLENRNPLTEIARLKNNLVRAMRKEGLNYVTEEIWLKGRKNNVCATRKIYSCYLDEKTGNIHFTREVIEYHKDGSPPESHRNTTTAPASMVGGRIKCPNPTSAAPHTPDHNNNPAFHLRPGRGGKGGRK